MIMLAAMTMSDLVGFGVMGLLLVLCGLAQLTRLP